MTVIDQSSQKTILQRLLTLHKKNRLAHAYIFSGPMYSGKGQTAHELVKALFCEGEKQEDPFCGQCPSCMKMDQDSHPDFSVLQCEYGEKIKIVEIRGVIDQVKLRPLLAPYKVFVIKNVENVTLEGSNALLKTLEEPASGNILILTTSVLEKVLPTIRSRCHTVYFLVSSNQKLEERLKNDYDVNSRDAHFLSYFAEGCLGKARHLNDEGLVFVKNGIIDEFIFSPDSESFIKETVSDKEKTKLLLDVLLSWVRDCILIKSCVEEGRLVHRDRLRELKRFADKFSFKELDGLTKEIVKTGKLLAENLNIKIPLLIIKEKLWGN